MAEAEPAVSARPLLAITDLHKSFGGVHALRGARLEVRSGEVHTLLGENGAGKSTLVKVIAGVYDCDRGDLEWDGHPLDGLDLATSHDLGIRVIHQRLNTVPHLTVAQNISLGREPRRLGVVDKRAERRIAREALDRIGSHLDIDKQAGLLPVAERQLIEIAHALQGDVRLLVMDEPTASLGEREVDRLFDVIRSLRAEGVAIVFISHKLDEVLRISDSITVMRDGRWIATVSPQSTSADALVEMMVGRQLGTTVMASPPVAGEGDALLEVDGLWTDSGLADVSFTLNRGEILGVYGLMGSGRTELARALAGADPIGAGTISLNGQQIAPNSPQAAKRLGIGLVPEERRQSVFELLSVRENLSAASGDLISSRGVLRSARERRLAAEVVADLGVRTPSTEERISNLSGGNQQKVVLGRWLSRNVPVLVLDDPTSGVDVGAKAEIYRLINAIAERGNSILMTSSELPELLVVSHRIVVLHRGRVAGILAGRQRTERNVLHLAVQGSEGASVD